MTGQEATDSLDEVVDAREETAAPTPSQARATLSAPTSTVAEPRGGLAASLLSLQRTAGNRETAALIRSGQIAGAPEARASDRKLARCAGGCTCGGTCRQDELIDELASAQLKRAVLQRATASARPPASGSAPPQPTRRIVFADNRATAALTRSRHVAGAAEARAGARSELRPAPAPSGTGRLLTAQQAKQLQRLVGNPAVSDLIDQWHATARAPGPAGTLLSRQTVASGPGGPDPCDSLLQEIVDLLNTVAQRYNDALNDRHGLYEGADPEHGWSWEGHRDRYYYDRERLRTARARWEADDRCRGRPLSSQQEEDLREAEEFSDKEYPARPAPSMSRSSQQDSESVWDNLRQHLPEYLVAALIAIGAVAAGVAIAACFGSGACEFGLALAGLGVIVAGGIAAAMRAAGIRDEPAA